MIYPRLLSHQPEAAGVLNTVAVLLEHLAMTHRAKPRGTVSLHRPENDILFLFFSKTISCIHKVRIAI